MLEKASVAVQFEIGVKHTVMYDVYNLCEMAFENKLSFLKVYLVDLLSATTTIFNRRRLLENL